VFEPNTTVPPMMAAIAAITAVGSKLTTPTMTANVHIAPAQISILEARMYLWQLSDRKRRAVARRREEILTNVLVRPRLLGLSENIIVNNTNLLCWNGNNLQIAGDMIRRVLRMYIEPNVEHAFYKEFDFDPVDYAQKHRVRIVMAIVTLICAFLKARDKTVLKPVQNYDEWSNMIRGPIVWAGGEDPVKSQDEIIEQDEERLGVARVMMAWDEVTEESEEFWKLKDVIDEVNAFTDLRDDERMRRRWPEAYEAMKEAGLCRGREISK
jgi:hypothetical protein